MKKHLNHYWLALALLLPALHACHDEEEAMPGAESGTAGKATVVRASIGDDGSDTRVQVQWGTQNVDDSELFMWNAGDQFKAYDITTAERNVTPTAYTFSIDGSYDEAAPSREADFTCPDFPSVAQHKIAALYGNFDFEEVQNESGMKGLFFSIRYSDNATQIQTDNPGNADLKHLKDKMPMWATATAEGNGKLSQVSFHHLSSLLRITLRNAGDAALQVEHVEIFSSDAIVAMAGKGIYLWEDGTMTELFMAAGQGATLYLENKDGSQYATIASGGGSYDCFLPVLARNDEYHAGTSSLTIKVKLKDDPTVKSVDIAGLNNFKIEAGMRYWFDLTVMADGTLAQTSTLTDYTWYTSNKEATEFSISTPGELRALANLVNGTEEALAAAGVSGAVSFEGKTIRLANDISGFMTDWKPIGKSASPFKGTFDGGGHSITGVYFNQHRDDYAGLFGYVEGGTVRNLRVSGRWATTANYVGGIVGWLAGGSTVENCIFSGEVSGASSVGGIAGFNYSSTIAGCYTKGSVKATNAAVGGIAGSNSSTITRCYSEATATGSGGGIAGSSGSGNSISHCYATGSISGIWHIGGIIGVHSLGTVENCIALNLALTRTSGSDTEFGRVAGELSRHSDPMQPRPILTSCAAFQGMTIKDAGGNDIYATATGDHGTDLTAAQCLDKATYTSYGFAEPTATDPGWAFDPAATWTYLPWNPAFESFPGISAADYRISVPVHLNGGGNVN